MSTLAARREFTDRLMARLKADPGERPIGGDFACVCTDLAADTWELFPIALVMTDGAILQLRGEGGALLAFDSVAERDQAVVAPARDFPDLASVEQLCWLPFNGIAVLRMRLARLKGDRA